MNGPGAGGLRASITRSTLWNFAGLAAPVPVALLAIPALIDGLGQARFGVLTIAWALMGYFGVFDFGLSRATTKYVARACHDGDVGETRQLFWTSATSHLALGLAGGVFLALAAPHLEAVLAVEGGLRDETRAALYVLAVSVPVVVLTSVSRGLLEAVHRFDLVNLVKVPASMVTYLGPLAALLFTNRLPPVVLVILAGRIAVLLVYLVMCFRVLPAIRTFAPPRLATLRPLMAISGWMTVGIVLTPVIVSLDRFAIGSTVSVAAVAVYAAPYEVVTKLWMFSGSLMGVLFPRFSISSADPASLRELYRTALVTLALCATPVAAAIVTFAPEFFEAWLGADMARDGVAVARWLTVGVLINVVAQVPFTALQATGHADAAGKLQLIQLPLYAAAAWIAASHWGVVGVAVAWTSRAAIDAVLMFAAATSRLGPLYRSGAPMTAALVAAGTAVFLVWCWQGVPRLASGLLPKAIVAAFSIALFTYAVSRSLHVRLSRSALLSGG